MTQLTYNSRTDLSIDISWHKHGISHHEHYFVDHLNCWRDIFPGSVLEKLFDAHDRGSCYFGKKSESLFDSASSRSG
ncbi:hypothetical protein [Desulfocicer niacini]